MRNILATLMISLVMLSIGCSTKKLNAKRPTPSPKALPAILSCPDERAIADSCEDALVTYILVDIVGLKVYYTKSDEYSIAIRAWLQKHHLDEIRLMTAQEPQSTIEQIYKIDTVNHLWQWRALHRATDEIRKTVGLPGSLTN